MALLCAVSLLSGYVQFMGCRAEFLARGAAWAVTWGQGSLMSSTLFIPLAVGTFTIRSAAGEHGDRNWQHMSALGLAGTVVAGELLHTVQTVLASALVSLTELVVIGLLLDLDSAEPGPHLAHVVSIAPLVWVTEAFIVWIGAITNSFAVIVSTPLLATIGGLVLSLAILPVVGLYLLFLITSAFAPYQPDDIVSVGSMLVTGSIVAVWAVFWASALLRRITRNP